MIHYGRQDVNEADIQAVTAVLRSDFLTQGPAIERFERVVADYCGAKYAVAVSNATSALHIACLAAGLGSRDILWTSPITFVASANCGRYCGAAVDFVDIDEKTYNMSADALEDKLRQAKKENRLPKIVVPVHLAGQSCDMKRIHALSEEYGFTVLEDASHGVGADYLKTKVGSCTFSDMAVFSFMKNFILEGALSKHVIHEKDYFWISFSKIREELPMLSGNSDSSIRRHISNLVRVGLIEKCDDDIAIKNRLSLYRLGKSYKKY